MKEVIVKPYAKSFTVNGQVVFPLTDPKHIAAKLEPLLNELFQRAFDRGVRHAKSEMRRVMGIREQRSE